MNANAPFTHTQVATLASLLEDGMKRLEFKTMAALKCLESISDGVSSVRCELHPKNPLAAKLLALEQIADTINPWQDEDFGRKRQRLLSGLEAVISAGNKIPGMLTDEEGVGFLAALGMQVTLMEAQIAELERRSRLNTDAHKAIQTAKRSLQAAEDAFRTARAYIRHPKGE